MVYGHLRLIKDKGLSDNERQHHALNANQRVPMSTYPHVTLQRADVYTCTIHTLDTLPLHMPGAIESRDLLRVLVFAAASRLSGHHACAQRERAPSGPTVLGHLAGQRRASMPSKATAMPSWPG